MTSYTLQVGSILPISNQYSLAQIRFEETPYSKRVNFHVDHQRSRLFWWSWTRHLF